MKFSFLILSLYLASIAQADLVSSFKKLEKKNKGAFALNYLQAPQGRVPVTEAFPGGWNLQFQAAFRNEVGEELATQFDFYVGNLFTTNYYELTGEYVYSDLHGSHPLDHAALVANAAAARNKAMSMTRHWVLEKYYVERFPNSSLAKGFRYRGISGSEFEQVYAAHFLNFYLTAVNNELQFIPALLLANKSPVGSSTTLDQARSLVSEAYESAAAEFGADDPQVKRMWTIRNLIHNQLSPSVIAEIDRYLSDYPSDEIGLSGPLREIRELLVGFFEFSAAKTGALAAKIGNKNIKAICDGIVARGVTTGSLAQLSEAVAALKTSLVVTKNIPLEKITPTLQVISSASLFINKEISSLRDVRQPILLNVLLDTLYMEGFLIQDNWTYLRKEALKITDVTKSSELLSDMIELGNDGLNQAFAPSLAQWKSVEPKMQNFIDDTIKSSSLNSVALFAQKLKGR